MILEYWKRHIDDKWYWHLIDSHHHITEQSGPLDNQLDCIFDMIIVIEEYPEATIRYRDKPGN